MNPIFREGWVRKVKWFAIIVKEPAYGRASTMVIIHYRPWWKVRRKLIFIHDRTAGSSTESKVAHAGAQDLIDRLKRVTNRFSFHLVR